MKRPAASVRLASILALLAVLAVMGTSALSDSVRQPDKLIILSTTDVKGKTSPCG